VSKKKYIHLFTRKFDLKYIILVLIVFTFNLIAQNVEWGWGAHRYINENAVDYLPAEMSFFQDHRQFLRDHSVDPDTDPLPGYYHYMDIDYYPAFFTGTLPHNWNTMIATYGLSTVENNGVVPWVVEWWTDSLSTLMASGQWNDAWQVAAELGHYVADSHQPLHVTLNYNGQLTGNNGIHSRYETSMINPHLSQLPLPTGTGIYWTNVIDSVFLYIEEVYPYVNSIMITDDLAYAQDPSYGNTYYNILWYELEQLTTISIQKAILDLASIWRTAWINAGSPSPLGIAENNQNPNHYLLAKAYPNPFNPEVTIEIEVKQREEINIQIYDINGRKVIDLFNGVLYQGVHKFKWNNLQAKEANSGTYFVRVDSKNDTEVLKLLFIK
jgi:type IX secretion system substrate protein/zinc dependent phospholipase C